MSAAMHAGCLAFRMLFDSIYAACMTHHCTQTYMHIYTLYRPHTAYYVCTVSPVSLQCECCPSLCCMSAQCLRCFACLLRALTCLLHLLTFPDLYCSGWAKFADWGQVSSINNLAGSVSWWFGLALWMTSVNYVRRRWYSVSDQTARK